MKLLYTHPNRLLVLNAKNIIELNYMSVLLRNEYSSAASGELPPTQTWLELWITEDLHYERALKLLADINQVGQEWQCDNCKELNGAAFEYCWDCHTYKADEKSI